MAYHALYDENRRIAWEYSPENLCAVAYRTGDGGRYDKRDTVVMIRWYDSPTLDRVDARIREWMDANPS